MTRYFLTCARIEGFRGINNEGDPLEIRFKSDAVNSIFAANGLGKSSLFEAFSYAITGTVPKLDRMVAAESAKEYYGNRFHSKERAEIVLTFTLDDGGADAVVKVVREKSGKRTVTSPSGVGNPEAFLESLNDETVLLDHHTFTRFLLDSPLDRGKSFSNLLGLSRLADVRQTLSAVSDTMAFNTDSEWKLLEAAIKLANSTALQKKLELKQDYLGLIGKPAVEPLDPVVIGADVAGTLAGVALLKDLCTNQKLSTIDFNKISAAIKTAEKSEDLERLKSAIGEIAALDALAQPAEEEAEQAALQDLCKAKEAAFAATKGPSFQDLYNAVRRVFDDGSWNHPNVCPACESTAAESPYAMAMHQLQHYQVVEELVVQLKDAWKSSVWPGRLLKLETKLVKPADVSNNQHGRIHTAMASGSGTEADLDAGIARLKVMEAARIARLQELKAQKSLIEGSLPPSLVTLIEQVEGAKRIKAALTEISKVSDTVAKATVKLATRKRWKTFVDGACKIFEEAEARLSEKLISGMTTQYKAMYAKIAGGAPIVPSLQQNKDSIDLHLRLEKFFTLSNTAATPLLSESYRNAIAIAIFLSAALQRKPTARFIILDDVTSSFDAGHQFELMEVLRTMVGLPVKVDGLQVIVLSHDGLLEKYFDKLNSSKEWNHQHLQRLPPFGTMMVQAQGAERLKASAEKFLNAGQTKEASPLLRQHLEFRLVQIISKVSIPVPLDFAIKDTVQMVGNCLDAIKESVDVYKAAGRLILTPQQQTDIGTMHVPSLISNWVSHYGTGSTASFDPYVLLGVLKTCEDFADCFKYDCSCKQPPGKTIRRYYKNLSSKGCSC